MGVNKVILLGNLGKDPELRFTSSQLPVCTFSLATGERRKDSSGNWADHTEWHTIVAFGKTAELAGNYLKKGRQVSLTDVSRPASGRIRRARTDTPLRLSPIRSSLLEPRVLAVILPWVIWAEWVP